MIAASAVGISLVGGMGIRTLLFGVRPPDDALLGATLAQASVTEVAVDLRAPWEVVFLDGGDLLLTERAGDLVRLAPDGTRRWTVPVPGVVQRGEGGLLGLALHPRFAETRWIYVYLTADRENRVERYELGDDGRLSGRTVLVDGIPAASFHDGGRLAFGPDGFLYATTGEAGNRPSARDPSSLGGKILRLTDQGGVPPGNPFGTLVWSLGHRNPQGLAWAPDGTLWATEHGRSGVSSGLDELNRIEPGGDYGWPEVQGDDRQAGVVSPVLHSGPEHTWAPSGTAWVDGRVWFGGLRGQALYEATPRDGGAELRVHFFGELGRIRDVRAGPDGMLWILTNNTDGRGRPRDGDDKLLRVDPAALVGR